MFDAKEFIKYCSQTLELHFGNISNEIINKIRIKKNLDGNSTDTDLKKFIDLIETNIGVLSGKHRAVEICNIIRSKVPEFISMPVTEEFVHPITKISDVKKVEEATKTDIENTTTTVEEIEEMWKITDEYIENKILVLLETGHNIIDDILAKLNIEEEDLADKIIGLDAKEFIILEDKNWILTEKGKDVLKERRKKLKLDYLHGNVDKEEFLKKLEYIKEQEKMPEEVPEVKEEQENVPENAEKEKVLEEDTKEEQESVPENAEKEKVLEEDTKEEQENVPEKVKEDEKKIICKCGRENKMTDRFCSKCGKPLHIT